MAYESKEYITGMITLIIELFEGKNCRHMTKFEWRFPLYASCTLNFMWFVKYDKSKKYFIKYYKDYCWNKLNMREIYQ